MLTDLKLRALKPTGKIYKITDQQGLYAAVTRTGVVSFRYDYRIKRAASLAIEHPTRSIAKRGHEHSLHEEPDMDTSTDTRDAPPQRSDERAGARLPETGFVRESRLLEFVPFSHSTLWRRVAARTFP